tara:strand:- start:94 stop:303 length:210 start_codon:yes stop_codon:yes gene_type:complete
MKTQTTKQKRKDKKMKYENLDKYLKRQARNLFKKEKIINPKIKLKDLLFTCEYDNPFSLIPTLYLKKKG